jgi:hypothetical protein
MAFVNLPPNFQDMFYSITDRIAKLETGPNQAMYTAESAQGSAQSASAQAANASAQAASAQAAAMSAQIVAASASAQATIASAQAVTAQATANTAYLAAQVASAQAITANNTANAAASQATIAQSQATIASSQATAAQVSANGKNNNYYSTSAPTSSTPNVTGDIWYQYGTSGTYANKVIAQWSGAGGTGPSSYVWTPVTVSGLVIANIDAGTVTTGILSAIQISAGAGGTQFTVSPGGYMMAQGAYIKGNITADSGTFNGQVNATSGYFGSLTNGWQINAGGIAGLGSGYISGGTIQGTNFNNGNGTFFVNSTGDLVAQSVYVKGAVLGTSGYFGNVSNGWNIDSAGITGIGSGYIAGGAIQGTTVTGGTVQTSTGSSAVILNGSSNAIQFKTSGSVVGNIVPLSSFGVLTHYGATPDPSGGTFPQTFVGSTNISMSASPTQTMGVSTTGINLTATTGGISLDSSTRYPGIATGAGSTMVVVTTGSRIAFTTSSERYKQDIEYIDSTGWLDKVLQMKPITYKTSEDFTIDGEPNETQIGFLAEDIYDIGGGLEKAVVLDPLGDPFSLSYDRLTVYLMLAIKELKAEVNTLKQQNNANS